MTAVLERPDTDTVEETATPCECSVIHHHPKQDCPDPPVYRIVLRHTGPDCKGRLARLYCKDCLDALLDKLQDIAGGFRCGNCGQTCMKISDLIGSITPIT